MNRQIVSILGTALLCLLNEAASQCLSDETLNAEISASIGEPIPTDGSCCQADVCGIPCPEPVSDPGKGYGIAVICAIIVSFLIGVGTYFVVHGKAVNFFVAGRSLPLWIVAMTLGAQSIDSNALLGNADLSYKYHFYDGAVIPIGLGISLLLNGIFLAHFINQDNVLTLPDVFAKRYGRIVECLTSIATIISFLMLLAGNLVGMGVITSYLWGTNETDGIWIAAAIVWAYTACGGLFSVAYTDVVQGAIGWTGCLVTAFWLIANSDPAAPPPSIGFPGYVYPDGLGDGGVCDMYQGVPCENVDGCCYNEALWCPSDDNCTADNGAYPIGDQRVFSDQMSNFLALTPFPNAIFWNWCTILILGFGNLGALDFQARCMASKTPRGARLGCIIGGCFTFLIGIPYAYLGAITRVWYGPDSTHAVFAADTCSEILGLPTCGQWVPDPTAFVKLLTHAAPPFLGGWCLIGIVAASMSTADGAILAMGTVFSHNLLRQFDKCFPKLVTAKNLLTVARISTIPFALIGAVIGSYYRSSHSAGATGYLLIVAFDVVLATVVPILFGSYYTKNPSPRAALVSVLVGGIMRAILEFTIPKDGYLLLPYQVDEFLDYGVAPSIKFPLFFDAIEADIWDPSTEPCVQRRYEDYTGADSLASFVAAILCFVIIQFWENCRGGRALFNIPGMTGYHKDTEDQAVEEVQVEKGVPMNETQDLSSKGKAIQDSSEEEEGPAEQPPVVASSEEDSEEEVEA